MSTWQKSLIIGAWALFALATLTLAAMLVDDLRGGLIQNPPTGH